MTWATFETSISSLQNKLMELTNQGWQIFDIGDYHHNSVLTIVCFKK